MAVRFLGLAAIVATIALAINFAMSGTVDSATDDPVASSSQVAVADSLEGGSGSTAERADAQSDARVSLLLRFVRKGEPAAVELAWGQSRWLHALPACISTEENAAPGRSRQVEGETCLMVKRGQWTLLRITCAGRSDVWRRLAPQFADTHVTIDIADAIVVVQVFEDDWQTPARRAKVVVESAGAPDYAVFAKGDKREADEDGFIEWAGLVGGRHLFRCDGVEAMAGTPYVVPLVWMPGGPDAQVTLIRQQPRHRLTLEVHVSSASSAAMGPKLFLRRLDNTCDRLYPQAGILQVGRQSIVFDVPAGRYGAAVIPVGELDLEGDVIVDVPETCVEARASIALTAARERASVRLLGLSPSDPPLRVNLEAADGLRYDDPDVMFAGPVHWTSDEATLPRGTMPKTLTCIGRHAAFVSAESVVLDQAHVDVALVQATCLQVEWIGGDMRVDEPPMLIVSGGAKVYARQFDRAMLSLPGGQVPALVARIVVPQGRYELEGRIGGELLWSREFTAAGKIGRVRVSDN